MLREGWEEQDVNTINVTQYIIHLREHLKCLGLFASENLQKAQQTEEQGFNRGACLSTFQRGD